MHRWLMTEGGSMNLRRQLFQYQYHYMFRQNTVCVANVLAFTPLPRLSGITLGKHDGEELQC